VSRAVGLLDHVVAVGSVVHVSGLYSLTRSADDVKASDFRNNTIALPTTRLQDL
jgi:hypothetical protein